MFIKAFTSYGSRDGVPTPETCGPPVYLNAIAVQVIRPAVPGWSELTTMQWGVYWALGEPDELAQSIALEARRG